MTGSKQQNSDEYYRLHILVTGRVQNVGFRAFVLQAGTILALTGWVRNVGYDKVETVAEGMRPALEEFSRMVNTGPRGSHVDELTVNWEAWTGEFSDFRVRSSQ
jgi:acylphosphatase